MGRNQKSKKKKVNSRQSKKNRVNPLSDSSYKEYTKDIIGVEIENDKYKMISQKLDKDNDLQDTALEIVKKFIIKENLILYGGLAIDYALRLRGNHIYPEFERADYDFYSPNHAKLSYKLADELEKCGFKRVEVIRAIHVQTMKVRINYIWVADISYVPQRIFDMIPTMKYENMKIVDPEWQRMDMHMALCFPLANPPMEDVFHRTLKDITRFNLLNEIYPMHEGDAVQLKKLSFNIPNAILPKEGSLIAFHGFAAYSLIEDALRILKGEAKSGCKITKSINESKIEFEAPLIYDSLDLIATNASDVESYFINDTKNPGKEFVRMRPFLDIRLGMTKIPDPKINLYSMKNRLISINILRDSKSETKVNVVSPNYLMLWFLYKMHTSENNSNIYRTMYVKTLQIMKEADDILGGMEKNDYFYKMVQSSPFGLQTRVMGNTNISLSMEICLAYDRRSISINTPEDNELLKDLPINYYTYKNKEHPSFDPKLNVLFQFDGESN